MPDALVVEPQSATLLGSPLGNVESISLSICDMTALLQVMGERLKYLCTHDSLLLLRNAFAIPKLMYLLRTSPCFLSTSLHLYDNELRNMLSSITNTFLDDRAWLQASLPVKSGGLGIRSAVHLAPSAYLATFAGCRELTFTILPPRFQESPLSLWDSAIAEWSTGHNESPPSGLCHIDRNCGIYQGFLPLPLNSWPLPLILYPRRGFYLPLKRNLVLGCTLYQLLPWVFAWMITLFA